MCRNEQAFLAISVVSRYKTHSAGAYEAQQALASCWISPFSPPRVVLPGNEFLLMGDLELGDIKSGLWALGADAQT